MSKWDVEDVYESGVFSELAFTCSVLEGWIKPEVRDSVINELDRRILVPFERDLKDYSSRKLESGKDLCSWLESRQDWNAVGIANILYTILAIDGDLRRIASLIVGCEEVLDDYFGTFEHDGYISSGMRHWNYGLSHFVLLAERLLMATNGVVDLYGSKQVRDVVRFPLNTRISSVVSHSGEGDSVVSAFPLFGSNKNPVPSEGLLWNILGVRFGLEGGRYKVEDSGGNVFWDLSLCSLYPSRLISSIDPVDGRRCYYGSSGMLISRNKGASISMTSIGGNNLKEDGHCQIGAYTLFDSGSAVFGTQGGLVYSRDTIFQERFSFSLNSSFGHPVPLVDGQMQNVLPSAKGMVLKAELSDGMDIIEYDLKSAYNVHGLLFLNRRISFARTGKMRMEVTDNYMADRPISFETALVVPGFSKTSGALITSGRFRVRVVNDSETSIERVYFLDPGGSEGVVGRYGVKLKERRNEGSVTYVIEEI